MGVLAVDTGKAEVNNEVRVSVASVNDEKDEAESGKPGPNRILRYAEVLVFAIVRCGRRL